MREFGHNFGWLGGRPAAATRMLVMALPLFVGACTFVPDWADPTDLFASDEAPTTVGQGQSAGTDSFPKLSSVPEAAPKTTAPATQADLRATLAADRTNAEYSGQRLVADTGSATGSAAGSAKMPTAVVGALPPKAPVMPPKVPAPVNTADATPAPTEPDSPAASQAEPPKPAKSTFRFTQFDTKTAAKPDTQPSARNSELVAVIYFAYGSTALSRNDREILRDVALLQKQSGGTVRVIGHASARTGVVDSVRYRLVNFETSLQRANAVTAQLVRLGVARDKVASEAKGDTQPVYHEFMPTGEAGNRRAEIFLEN